MLYFNFCIFDILIILKLILYTYHLQLIFGYVKKLDLVNADPTSLCFQHSNGRADQKKENQLPCISSRVNGNGTIYKMSVSCELMSFSNEFNVLCENTVDSQHCHLGIILIGPRFISLMVTCTTY